MNLIIDSGNSSSKVAIFDGNRLVTTVRYDKLSKENLDAILSQYPDIKRAILSAVASLTFDIDEYFADRSLFFINMNHDTPMPIINGYSTPKTLGMDRLAAAVGAKTLFPSRELLVVDMGSAITIDRVSKDGVFLGGNISPGVDMRFRALNKFTSKLPLCEKNDNFSICGKNSNDAIIGGVIYGIAKELDGYIDDYRKQDENILIIFTGGDAKYFENRLKNAIFADCETLVKGLNEILEYNVTKI